MMLVVIMVLVVEPSGDNGGGCNDIGGDCDCGDGGGDIDGGGDTNDGGGNNDGGDGGGDGNDNGGNDSGVSGYGGNNDGENKVLWSNVRIVCFFKLKIKFIKFFLSFKNECKSVLKII